MTALTKGTPEYDAVFGGEVVSGAFVSYGPTYTEVTNSFLNGNIAGLFNSPAVVNGGQARDMRNSMRFLVHDLVVNLGDQAGVNMPSNLLLGVSQLIQNSEPPASLDDAQVTALFQAVADGDPGKIAGALVGVGLAAVSVALPVVGLIGAAIVGLAAGIAKIVKSQGEKLDSKNAEARALLYRSFPPLQVEDSEMDAKCVEVVMRPMMRTRDWTRIFTPQFKGDFWIGKEREGGFAFAPGYRDGIKNEGVDQFGQVTDFFVPTDGLGVIPGTHTVTAVVQVSLVHDPAALGHEAWTNFAAGKGPDPRGQVGGVYGWTRVKDTGMYFNATGRAGGCLWQMATADWRNAEGLTPRDRARLQTHGNALRYRVDILALHAAWKAWADAGLRFIRERCYPWFNNYVSGSGVVDPNADLEGFFGTASFYAWGMWGGYVSGGTVQKPQYSKFDAPYGYSGPQLPDAPKAYGKIGSSMSSHNSGAFLPIRSPLDWPDELMATRYERGPLGSSIKATLDQARYAQEYELGRTLVAAYVSAADAAFTGDPALLDRLWKLRAALLKHPDRLAIDMRDVGEDELGVPDLPHADSWREQLLAAGVPAFPPAALPGNQFELGAVPQKASYCEAGIWCGPSEPPPERPPQAPGPDNPFEPLPAEEVPIRHGRKPSGSGVGLALGLTVAGVTALGTALAIAKARENTPRRNFVAGSPNRFGSDT
jgi:hypothetical protein